MPLAYFPVAECDGRGGDGGGGGKVMAGEVTEAVPKEMLGAITEAAPDGAENLVDEAPVVCSSPWKCTC